MAKATSYLLRACEKRCVHVSRSEHRKPVVRFGGKQAGRPVWHTGLEIYVPDSVIRWLESCFVFAVTDAAQLATRLIFSNLMLRLAGPRPSSSEKRPVRRCRGELQSCRDDELVYAKRDVVLSNH